jgi:cell division protein FtsB
MKLVDHVKSAALRAARQTIGPALAAAVVGYFLYHAIQGDRGLIALTHLQGQISQAEAVLGQVRGEREHLEQRASLLRSEHLDPDMLDERARSLLNYSNPNDMIILLPRGSHAPPVTTPPPNRVTP